MKVRNLLQFVESPFISFSPSTGVAHLRWVTLCFKQTACSLRYDDYMEKLGRR